MPEPATHLFEVTLQVEGWSASRLAVYLPVWTPGSYLVREYARHLQGFTVEGERGPLTWQKVGKNHWCIQTAQTETVTLHYQVFANELTVRTNHLDLSHGYFNPAALLMYVPELRGQPSWVTVVPPQADWRVATPLPAIPDQPYTFLAADYDTLVDSPFEVGIHQRYEFEVLGKPHAWVVWGQGNLDPERLMADTQKIVETTAAIFGGLPYDRYLFLLHLWGDGFGGLEHKDACSLLYSRFHFREPAQYHRFLQLVAHEFFHLWNVKRIRPEALETFDYNQENYTSSLWFCEGVTSYYDLLIPLRAGIYTASTFLAELGKDITRLQTTPGRQVQSLSESSFDAWIKLYRRDAQSNNSQVSYYLKGLLFTCLLDLLIRTRHQNQRSFDQVLQQLWLKFGQPEVGYSDRALQMAIEDVAGTGLHEFFQRYLYGTEELPFDQFLRPFGLCVQLSNSEIPHLGLTVALDAGRSLVQFVEANSPAQKIGLEPGDELLAIDQFRVSAEQLDDRLKNYHPGEAIVLTWFHGDQLRSDRLTLAPAPPTQWEIVSVENPSPAQLELRQGWLKSPQADPVAPNLLLNRDALG